MRETPRERTMPLVPQPFDRTIISRQSAFLGAYRGSPMAQEYCRFCPNLVFRQYLLAMSEEKRTELSQRASKLLKRASINHVYKSSEFSWEICAWNDVFGLILDDEGLRMDKRPYDFTEKDNNGQFAVKTRIPDATMGLKSYDSYFLKRGYICTDPDCKDDHIAKQPDERLSENLLSDMMQNPECGLIVDGVYAAAEEQIYHACRTYLAMLDDLARNPDNVSEYQSQGSDRYQLFAFTSCGSYWQVFIAWNFMNDCMVETIWEGDVKQANYAIELICIIDQVHDYATQQHRPFVMKHLEAWHDRHKRTTNLVAADDNPFMASLFDLSPNMPQPEWSRLKAESKMTRSEKAQQTRAHNQELRGLATQAPELKNTLGQKRARGRPPKAATHKRKPLKKGQQAQSSRAISGRAVTKTKPHSSRVTRSMNKGL
ncbi:hypothetical protein ACJZ2D_015613 [Fusarium nematophilum]